MLCLLLCAFATATSAATLTLTGNLSLVADNDIDASTDLQMDGGTLALDGYNQSFTNLTLTADSVIDFGDADSILT
ncbi:MAG: hypothetical protein CUN55_21560, partial [Phototrophicales bacterium]